MDEESFCFLHDFPTKHLGTWGPKKQDVACGNEECKMLATSWATYLYLGNLGNANWLRRRSQECDVCDAERKRRCCVLDSSDLSPTLDLDQRFAVAPYIDAFNEPKYHASQIRALQFGMQKKSVVMWLIAEDRPLSKNIGLLQDRSIDEQRKKLDHIL